MPCTVVCCRAIRLTLRAKSALDACRHDERIAGLPPSQRFVFDVCSACLNALYSHIGVIYMPIPLADIALVEN